MFSKIYNILKSFSDKVIQSEWSCLTSCEPVCLSVCPSTCKTPLTGCSDLARWGWRRVRGGRAKWGWMDFFGFFSGGSAGMSRCRRCKMKMEGSGISYRSTCQRTVRPLPLRVSVSVSPLTRNGRPEGLRGRRKRTTTGAERSILFPNHLSFHIDRNNIASV